MGIEQRHIELINAEIDGQISAADRALLERYLDENHEARIYRDELRNACALLDSQQALNAPPGIRDAVLEEIRPRVKPAAGRGSLAERINSWFAIPALKYSMSFAAGVILTVTLITSDRASRQTFDDVTSLVGTISSVEIAGKMTASDNLQLTLNELAGSVGLLTKGPLMVLDFDLASTQPIEIVVRFDNRDIWFNGFAQLESSGTTVAAETGRVTVRMDGQRRYAVYLHNSGRTEAIVKLEFYSSGTLLHEGELRFREKN